MHAKRLRLILHALNQAEIIADMALPGFKLHPLKGDMQGMWSVSVSGNWRIIFRFDAGNAYIVNYLDYH